MRLYHATYKENMDAILKDGIRRYMPQNFEGMSMNDCVYFAIHPQAALDFVESSDTYEDQEIVVFAVDSKDLDMRYVTYDWNNRCEYENDIISIAYQNDVDSRCLSVFTKEEIDRTDEVVFSDLKHLDDSASKIWEKVGTIFDEEVETNKENEQYFIKEEKTVMDTNVYGEQSRWFDVDEENIENIKRRGYLGKDGIDIGYKAAYISDGFEVITKEEYNKVYGIEQNKDEEEYER